MVEERLNVLELKMDKLEARIEALTECFAAPKLKETMDKIEAKMIQMQERIIGEMRKFLGVKEEKKKQIDDQSKHGSSKENELSSHEMSRDGRCSSRENKLPSHEMSRESRENKLSSPAMSRDGRCSSRENKLSSSTMSMITSSCSSSATSSHNHSESSKGFNRKWDFEITLSEIEIQCKYIMIDEKMYQTRIKSSLGTRKAEALSRLEGVKMILFHPESKSNYEMNLMKLESTGIGKDISILLPWIVKHDNDIFEDLGLCTGDKLRFDVLKNHFHFEVIHKNGRTN